MKSLQLIILPFLLWSCSTSRHVQMQVAEHISKDTIYLTSQQYDSIYISHASDIDRTRDTITITKTMTEYRYKLLKDTIRISKRDSIPYEVRIIETREVPRKLTWYDHTARATFWLLIGVILLWLYRRLHKR